MAGRAFPVKIGGRNSGTNQRVMNALRSGVIRHNRDDVFWYRQVVRLADLTLPAATTGTFNLDTLYPNNAFYDNVQLRPGGHIYVIENGEGGGITALTISMGGEFEAGTDADGILTATPIFLAATIGTKLSTPAAAEYNTETLEPDFTGTFTLDSTTDDLDALEQLAFEAFIPYSPLRSNG